MRKLVSLILIALLSVSSFSFIAYAADPVLSLAIKQNDSSPLVINKNVIIDVDVKLSATTDLYSFVLEVDYDPDYLAFESIAPVATGMSAVDGTAIGKVVFMFAKTQTAAFTENIALVKFKSLKNNDDVNTKISINKTGTVLSKEATDEKDIVKIDYTTTDLDLVKPEPPEITPTNNSYYNTQSFSIRSSITTRKHIYFTTNGTDPCESGNGRKIESNSASFVLNTGGTHRIRARVLHNGVFSEELERRITMNLNGSSSNGSSGNSGSNIIPGGNNPNIIIPPDYGSVNNNTQEKYGDIVNHWANSFINRLIDLKVVNGYEDGTVRPDGTVTRAEAAKILVSARGYNEASEINLTFGDTWEIADWAKGWIQQAINLGIMNGYPEDNTFKPSNGLSRKELAAMAMRAYGLGDDSGIVLTFDDAGTIAQWAYGYVAKAVSLGIITGYEDNTFLPDRLVTRAEACAIISRCLDI